VGGETFGVIKIMVDSPDKVLEEGLIEGDLAGKIIVGGSYVTLAAIRKAVTKGVKGIVAGGFSNQELKELLGYEQGVAITGTEELGLTLIVTEGFGKINMAHRTFDLLGENQGLKASMSGATQIRAGVIRPEIIIAHPESKVIKEAQEIKGLEEGNIVRIIREPYFGKLGKVTGLPSELQVLETEAKVRVLEVELESGERVILPRANIERIED
jgi:transcription antitermination factor NusG